jgi:ferrous iron transport protein A
MQIPVSELAEGAHAKVTRITGPRGFQRKLRTAGLREGKTIKLLTKQPLRGPLVVEVEGRKLTLGRGMARHVLVERLE